VALVLVHSTSAGTKVQGCQWSCTRDCATLAAKEGVNSSLPAAHLLRSHPPVSPFRPTPAGTSGSTACYYMAATRGVRLVGALHVLHAAPDLTTCSLLHIPLPCRLPQLAQQQLRHSLAGPGARLSGRQAVRQAARLSGGSGGIPAVRTLRTPRHAQAYARSTVVGRRAAYYSLL
jgi:hypothetical protein